MRFALRARSAFRETLFRSRTRSTNRYASPPPSQRTVLTRRRHGSSAAPPTSCRPPVSRRALRIRRLPLTQGGPRRVDGRLARNHLGGNDGFVTGEGVRARWEGEKHLSAGGNILGVFSQGRLVRRHAGLDRHVAAGGACSSWAARVGEGSDCHERRAASTVSARGNDVGAARRPHLCEMREAGMWSCPQSALAAARRSEGG